MSRVVETIKRIIRAIVEPMPSHGAPRSPVPDAMPLRSWAMPADAREAASVRRRWDVLNGRYYLIADVVLEDGAFLRDVTFDGDTQVAVEVGKRCMAEFPAYFGKRIVDFFTVADCEAGTFRFQADEQRRAAFAEQHSAAGGAAAP